MKISHLLILVLLFSNCSKELLIPLENGYAIFDPEAPEDSVSVNEYNHDDLLTAKGQYSLYPSGKPTTLKKGHWIYYHDNGQLKSKGTYKVGSYIECCTAGPCEQLYNYKFGDWEYYHSNGQLKAKGRYQETNLQVNTNCQEGDDFPFGLTTGEWKFYARDGELTELSTTELREYETVKTEFLRLDYFVPDSTRTNIELISNGYNKR